MSDKGEEKTAEEEAWGDEVEEVEVSEDAVEGVKKLLRDNGVQV